MPAGRDFECLQGKKAVIASLVCKITLIIIELCKALWEDSLIERYYIVLLRNVLNSIFFALCLFTYMNRVRVLLKIKCEWMIYKQLYLNNITHIKLYKIKSCVVIFWCVPVHSSNYGNTNTIALEPSAILKGRGMMLIRCFTG